MRKTGLGFAAFGGVLGVILFFVRRTAWYASEAASNLSEPAEWIEATFWACIITLAVGIFLLLWSLRKRPEEVPQSEEAYHDGFDEAPFYDETGEMNIPAYDGEVYTDTGRAARRFEDPWEPEPADAVWRPEPFDSATRRVPVCAASEQDKDWPCEICGCRNPAFSTVCAVCGSERGSRLE